MCKTISIFIFFLWLSSACISQTPGLIFRHITRSSGLPVDIVTCLAKDSSGFIWIGSNEGLFRYDGAYFKPYLNDPALAKTLPANSITKICVTRKGQLWIATVRGGVALMNSTGEIIKVINSSTTALFSKEADYSTDVKEDKKGNIWLTTLNGLFRISADGEKIESFYLDKSPATPDRFFTFFFDVDDNLWLGTSSGLKIFDSVKSCLKDADELPYHFNELKRESFFSALAIHHNNLWYSTWKPNLGVYDTALKKNTYLYSAAGNPNPDFTRMANAFYVDSKDALWIATAKGLLLYLPGNTAQQRPASFLHTSENPFSILDNHVNAILEDRDGDLWFGTDKGISIARPYSQFLYNYSENDVKQYPFGNKMVSDVIETGNNKILIGTTEADGVYLTDLNFNVQKHFFFNTVSYDWIWNHYTDKPRNRIFISTQKGLLVYDKKTGNLKIEKDGIFKNWHSIRSFVATSDSILWVCLFRNVFRRYNLNTEKFTEYSLTGLGEDYQILDIAKDKQNNIWLLANAAGLLQFDEHTGKIIQRLEALNSEQSLRQTQIYFFKDLGDCFIIGYEAMGISLYYKKTKKYEHFTQATGLISNSVRDAFIAKDGSVWIATTNGISHFNPILKRFKNYGYNDGILNNSFISITQLEDGRIVAGSTKGLTAFNPAAIPKLPNQPLPPVFMSIKMYGKNISIDSLVNQNKTLQISYKENYFSIDYVSPEYNNSRQLEYACMLKGLDKDWINMGNSRFVSYANIKGGRYVFRVKVRSYGGQWVESINNLQIKVESAFYTRWWFFLVIGLAAVALIYAMIRYRILQLLKLERMRSTISSDLHDEVGASLTSISIFSEMAKKTTLPLSKEEQYLQRIGERSRESIEKMADIIWSINPNNDSLEQMLVRMKNYTTEVAEAKDIAIYWEETGSSSHALLSMEQRKNIYLFYKEAVNNIIKHADAKNIYIQLQSFKNNLTLTIKDDGKGFDINIANEGNGLKNMKRRAGLIKGTIDIASADKNGTSIHLNIPY